MCIVARRIGSRNCAEIDEQGFRGNGYSEKICELKESDECARKSISEGVTKVFVGAFNGEN